MTDRPDVQIPDGEGTAAGSDAAPTPADETEADREATTQTSPSESDSTEAAHSPRQPVDAKAGESAPESSVADEETPAADQKPNTTRDAVADTVSEGEPAVEQEKPREEDTPEVGAPPAPTPERPEVAALRTALTEKQNVEGTVIGWNKGGLHVVVGGVTAFCPRSEIEIGSPKDPRTYLDKSFPFRVLKVQRRGRRVVVSRRAVEQSARNQHLQALRAAQKKGDVLEGKVSSITDFGAFVDLGGIEGLVHVSEISRARVGHPSEKLSEGQTVGVRVLKVSDRGDRISLSMKALEPDPWGDLEKRLPVGEVVAGVVEKTSEFGAFVEIAPGVTGLLPTSAMNLPRGASAARIYHAGKKISVQVLGIDRRRRRISLALEGSQVEGTRADLKSYLEQQQSAEGGFGALAAAFDKARRRED